MFSFQSGELSFQVSNDLEDNSNIGNANTNLLYPHKVEEQVRAAAAATNNNLLYQPHNDLNTSFKIPNTRNRGAGKSMQGSLDGGNINNEDGTYGNEMANKKVIHREVERQRRQEMSNLHSSLRSLLPMEYIRGKRSVTEHITEATRYIKDLEKNVKELGWKRDRLKDSLENQRIKTASFGCSSSTSITLTTSRSSGTSGYNVSIHKFSKTIQIEITAGVVEEDPYPLSNTLRVLAQEGLDVASCVSTIVNQRRTYVIYCEVNDETSVDPCHLQEKLMSIVSSSDS